MKVNIEATQDGQHLVEVEQAFATLDEAIEAARAALGGEDSGQKPMIDGEDAFVAGYKRARGGEG